MSGDDSKLNFSRGGRPKKLFEKASKRSKQRKIDTLKKIATSEKHISTDINGLKNEVSKIIQVGVTHLEKIKLDQ